MTEGGPKNQKEKPLSDFDSFVAAASELKSKAEKEGRAVPETPAIDNYINKRKKQAGSPPDVLEREES